MIDSIIYLGAGTKAGSLSTIVADFDKTDLARFARKVDAVDALDTSRGHRVKIVTDKATYDQDRKLVTPEQTLAGFAILISTEDQRIADLLWALPDNVCRVQFDRESGKVLRTRIPLATLRTLS